MRMKYADYIVRPKFKALKRCIDALDVERRRISKRIECLKGKGVRVRG